MLVLLFPVISATDDLHAVRAVMEEPGTSKRSIRQAGNDKASEEQAWQSLAEMWPTADVDRIRAAILSARARGIGAQVNGVSPPEPPGNRQKHARIFNAISESVGSKLEVTPPKPIMIRRPPLLGIPDQDSSRSELPLELVIDSAGKVRSAEAAGKATPVDAILAHAAAGWKVIPAFKDGRAVASRMRIAVSMKQ